MKFARLFRAKLLASSLFALVSACAHPPLAETPAVSSTEPPVVSAGQPSVPVKSPAGSVRLRPDHPQTYLVAPEDTLYEVATRFLETPWRWPEVWRPEPGASDPELIYPGEIVELYYEHGQPRLRIAQGQAVVKLSPRVRAESISQPIPAIPRSAIEGFLTRTLVLNPADWETAPRIVGNTDERVVLGSGDRIYARGSFSSDQRYYRVFHRADEYHDPVKQQSLGVAGIYAGDAVLQEEGDPATLVLTTGRRDARIGDYLFPIEDEVENYSFLPHSPPEDTEGLIIAVPDNTVLIGQYQSVVVNLGEQDGMEPGHMLRIQTTGRAIGNPLIGSAARLPDENTGLLMLYKVHDRVSYGLVMNSARDARVFDRVTTP